MRMHGVRPYFSNKSLSLSLSLSLCACVCVRVSRARAHALSHPLACTCITPIHSNTQAYTDRQKRRSCTRRLQLHARTHTRSLSLSFCDKIFTHAYTHTRTHAWTGMRQKDKYPSLHKMHPSLPSCTFAGEGEGRKRRRWRCEREQYALKTIVQHVFPD